MLNFYTGLSVSFFQSLINIRDAFDLAKDYFLELFKLSGNFLTKWKLRFDIILHGQLGYLFVFFGARFP